MKRLSNAQVSDFRAVVRAHYRANGRSDLPWRATRDPYRILVSEFMLQQTQVARVLEHYRPFIERFPGFRALAAAPLRDVLASWSGLGYNRRAKHLADTARAVVARHGGRLPRDLESLRSLPGVGPATAAAVAAFAFGEAHSFIETNIRTVFIHHFFPRRRSVGDEEIAPLVERTLDRRAPRSWYYALMDYGVDLKKRHGNPARRSAHHTRQTRFEGSMRQARGAVIRTLGARSMTAREIAAAAGIELDRVHAAAAALEKDGLITSRGAKLVIAPRRRGGGG